MSELVFSKGAKSRPQDFARESFLAAKVVIDGGLVDPRLGDDGAHASRVVAAIRKQTLGSFEDVLARDVGGRVMALGAFGRFSNSCSNSKYTV